MRAHFLLNIFLFLLVHNSQFLENLIKNYCIRTHILMWSSAEWVNMGNGGVGEGDEVGVLHSTIHWVSSLSTYKNKTSYHKLRARRALLQFKDVTLRTRRALSLYKVNGNSALLVLNGISLICNNALLALNWQYIPGGKKKTEQSIQSIFQDFALINNYLFSPCWIEHVFLIIITPRSSNLVENFLSDE